MDGENMRPMATLKVELPSRSWEILVELRRDATTDSKMREMMAAILNGRGRQRPDQN